MRLFLDWQIAREEELRLLPREDFLERLRKELEPLDDELRILGLETGQFFANISVKELRSGYQTAVPLIIEYLKKPMTDRARAGLAHLLCERVPAIQKSWPEIVTLFKDEPVYYEVVRNGQPCRQELDTKDFLANALVAAYTPKRLPELVELLQNRSHGGSRVILLSLLRQRKGSSIDALLMEMLHDPDLSTELSSWKRFSERLRVN